MTDCPRCHLHELDAKAHKECLERALRTLKDLGADAEAIHYRMRAVEAHLKTALKAVEGKL